MSIQEATDIRLVLTTAETLEDGRRIAAALVERRLAACVNIMGAVNSIYRWRDKVEHAEEVLLLIKTGFHQLEKLEEAFGELHPYEVPELLVLGPESGGERYLNWLRESLGD
ncbi:MAG: divalent-cation tolerance protein CutA [Acidobacteria bacterium]|nr:divalent-cation tolerance protein CutA [Acidobacteriota bacterium]MBW4044864.1 divalent-cation tolerance protein CutA [Acidobacteriota bacterium]